jgi:FKBP-type peptidyl-prolyl cis-trans isomerase FkpA/FKBP-type peptidyl-prolyl cis-trans isomerase FklB
MRFVVSMLAVLALIQAPAAGAQEPKTDQDRTLYALGAALANTLQPFGLSAAELELVKSGLTDGVLGRPKIDPSEHMGKIQELREQRAVAVSAAEKKAGDAYVAKAAKEPGARKLESGVVVIPVKPGTGASPKATDKVKVHYHGTLTDGTVFDSSVKRGQPVSFPLGGVIKCWTEGVQQMKVGGKSRLVCPSDTAYGDRGAPPRIKPGATLVFEVELLDIEK